MQSIKSTNAELHGTAPEEEKQAASVAQVSSRVVDLPDDAKARDINVKIYELENEQYRLTDAFSRSHENTQDFIADIKQRNSEFGKEFKGLYSKLKGLSSSQEEAVSRLKESVGEQFSAASTKIKSAEEQLGQQQKYIGALVKRQAELARVQTTLARKDAALEEDLLRLKNQTAKQFNANEARISTLNEQYQGQRDALRLVVEDYDELRQYLDDIADQLVQVELDMSNQAQISRNGDRNLWIGGGIMAVILASAIAVVQFNPSVMPVAVANQLTELREFITGVETKTAEINERVVGLGVDVQINQDNMAAFNEFYVQNEARVAALESSAASFGSRLGTLDARLESIEKRLAASPQAGRYSRPPVLPLNDASWIDSQSRESYTIQLLGSYRLQGLVDFVNRNADSVAGNDMAVNKGLNNGKDWYNLYYGSFTSFSEAQAALRSLPSSVGVYGPWIRSFGAVQDDAMKVQTLAAQ